MAIQNAAICAKSPKQSYRDSTNEANQAQGASQQPAGAVLVVWSSVASACDRSYGRLLISLTNLRRRSQQGSEAQSSSSAARLRPLLRLRLHVFRAQTQSSPERKRPIGAAKSIWGWRAGPSLLEWLETLLKQTIRQRRNGEEKVLAAIGRLDIATFFTPSKWARLSSNASLAKPRGIPGQRV